MFVSYSDYFGWFPNLELWMLLQQWRRMFQTCQRRVFRTRHWRMFNSHSAVKWYAFDLAKDVLQCFRLFSYIYFIYFFQWKSKYSKAEKGRICLKQAVRLLEKGCDNIQAQNLTLRKGKNNAIVCNFLLFNFFLFSVWILYWLMCNYIRSTKDLAETYLG